MTVVPLPFGRPVVGRLFLSHFVKVGMQIVLPDGVTSVNHLKAAEKYKVMRRYIYIGVSQPISKK